MLAGPEVPNRRDAHLRRWEPGGSGIGDHSFILEQIPLNEFLLSAPPRPIRQCFEMNLKQFYHSAARDGRQWSSLFLLSLALTGTHSCVVIQPRSSSSIIANHG